MYTATGRGAALTRLLDEIDLTLLSDARKQAEKENIKIDEEQIRKFRPTTMMRRILELQSYAAAGRREELVALLKARGSVLGPPDDWGNWEAIEAARLLALTPNESVPVILKAIRQPQPLAEPWLAYALGCCGGVEALTWLRERASREENIWAARSLVFAIGQAGPQGLPVLTSLAARGNGNLKLAIEQFKKGQLDKPKPDYAFPEIPPKADLPTSIVGLRGK